MKSLSEFALGILLFLLAVLPAQAGFTSLYAFGDGACTTTNGPGGSLYYGKSYSNGRVFIEVLAQWQGLSYESNKNWSYFGHYSSNLLVNLTNFPAPPDSSNALHIVWVINADFVFNMGNYSPYTSNNIAPWTNAINRSLTNHFKAITNLYYAKGARALIMPNAVDITRIPQYNGLNASQKSFVRDRVHDFNTSFASIVSNATATLPGLTIYSPDVFSLLENVVTNAASYGLTNTLNASGKSIGVIENPALSPWVQWGPGTNYIFWDYWHPTAKFHMVLADFIQQIISPVQIDQITSLPGTGSNQLDMVNVPVGRAGLLEGSTHCDTWGTDQSFTPTATSQPILVPATDPCRFYRLRFPLVWTWP